MRTCEGCGNKMPFGTKRHRVDGQLVCDGCRNGRPGMPRTQINRQGAQETPMDQQRVAHLVRMAEFPPKKKDGGSAPAAPKPSGMPGAPPMAHPGMPPMPGHPMDPMGMGMGMGMGQQPQQPATPFAPDQQSDMVVRVCPFCGSGHLTGQSDGSIKCGYDNTVFTITVMPAHPFQPLVNPDGSPFQMPQDPNADPNPQVGQASAETTPGEGPADPLEQTPPGQAPNQPPPPASGGPAGADGAPPAPGAPAGALDMAFQEVMAEAGGLAPAVPQDQAAPAPAGQAPAGPPQAGDDAGDDQDDSKQPPWMKKKKSSAMFVTASGIALPEDAYIDHLRRTVLGS